MGWCGWLQAALCSRDDIVEGGGLLALSGTVRRLLTVANAPPPPPTTLSTLLCATLLMMAILLLYIFPPPDQSTLHIICNETTKLDLCFALTFRSYFKYLKHKCKLCKKSCNINIFIQLYTIQPRFSLHLINLCYAIPFFQLLSIFTVHFVLYIHNANNML